MTAILGVAGAFDYRSPVRPLYRRRGPFGRLFTRSCVGSHGHACASRAYHADFSPSLRRTTQCVLLVRTCTENAGAWLLTEKYSIVYPIDQERVH